MFLFCILFIKKMFNTYRICWTMFKLKKHVAYSLCVFGAFTCCFHEMIKIDVLDLVPQCFRTKTPNISIFNKVAMRGLERSRCFNMQLVKG